MKWFVYLFPAFLFSSPIFGEISDCKEDGVRNFDISNFLSNGLIKEEEKTQMINYLSLLEDCNPILFSRTWGEINQFGLLGVVNIEKAIKFYEMASNSHDLKSHYYLGAIYYSDSNFRDIDRASYHTEVAARGGIKEAIINSFFMKQHGHFDGGKLLEILREFSGLDDDLFIIYAQEQYYYLRHIKDEKGFSRLVDELLIHNGSRKGDVFFLLARIFLDDNLSLFDKDKGIEYLSASAAHGKEAAIELLKAYGISN